MFAIKRGREPDTSPRKRLKLSEDSSAPILPSPVTNTTITTKPTSTDTSTRAFNRPVVNRTAAANPMSIGALTRALIGPVVNHTIAATPAFTDTSTQALIRPVVHRTTDTNPIPTNTSTRVLPRAFISPTANTKRTSTTTSVRALPRAFISPTTNIKRTSTNTSVRALPRAFINTTANTKPTSTPQPTKPAFIKRRHRINFTLRTCTICFEDLHPSSFRVRPTARCTHGPESCRRCISTHLRTVISAGDPPACPVDSCDPVFTYDDIRRAVSPKLASTFAENLNRNTLRILPGFFSCVTGECRAGHFHEGGADSPIVTCPECGVKACFTHKVLWHAGKSCEQYDEHFEKEKAEQARLQEAEKVAAAKTEKYFSQHRSSVCPGCGARIKKTSGCDHMTCSLCKTQFCYACDADYAPILRRGNHHHKKDCQHYRPRR